MKNKSVYYNPNVGKRLMKQKDRELLTTNYLFTTRYIVCVKKPVLM